MIAQIIPVFTLIIDVYCVLIFVWCIASMVVAFNPRFDRNHPAIHVLTQLTAPVIRPIQRMLPGGGAMDISPLLAVFVLRTLEVLVVRVLGGLQGL